MTLHITQLSPALGALVEGIDLSKPLDSALRKAVENALLSHQVLFFRDQSLTPQQQAAFAHNFGDLHIHPIYPNIPEQPEVLVLDTAVTDVRDNALWHTDVTFLETPALGAVLAAKQLPPYGGDTLWASSSAAYDALSKPIQQLLEGLTATHDLAHSFPEERFGLTAEELQRLHADHAVLTIGAVDSSGMFMDYNADEAYVARAMIASARQTTILADSSKLCRHALFQVCEARSVQRLVTDKMPPASLAEVLRAAAVEVLVAEVPLT